MKQKNKNPAQQKMILVSFKINPELWKLFETTASGILKTRSQALRDLINIFNNTYSKIERLKNEKAKK